MDLFEYSDYGVIPSGNGLNVVRQYVKSNCHAEKITFHENYVAWMVELLHYRLAQRAWAHKKFRKLGCKDAITLIGYANYFLSKPLSNRKNADGTDAYQWLQRWLRGELLILKNATMDWLEANATSTVTFGTLSEQNLWLCPKLGNMEVDYAPRLENGSILVRTIDIDGIKVSAPVLNLPENVEDYEEITNVKNLIKDVGTIQSQDVLQKLWFYLSPSIEDTVYAKAAPTWPLFPDPKFVGRNAKGGNVMAKWLLVQKYKKARQTYSPHEVKKQEEKENKAERIMRKISDPDSIWGF